ncbi:hypothetical protein LEP1GSC151_0489 [Leptospira interrogans serovar Grippotyphosa str. LT2186]|uniref:Uncharacterized protein n=3 Tax=Leptospira interrogans TaxID=173 RepID=M3HXG1_LEPIR|nr:hypothetical protein LEP1GSC067_0102 [Leptospira interrogans serovar Lora str. TE 1992]EMG08357.1 hypothetical protein LEP1GSC151_0489 [Leptospira interrogans serovar Grippotyphosa str. LT2186]EMG22249.1 hypothetical protein LEP1GSC150_4625 [Leptospira interrogans serovar Copenhageni str. LT2050]
MIPILASVFKKTAFFRDKGAFCGIDFPASGKKTTLHIWKKDLSPDHLGQIQSHR